MLTFSVRIATDLLCVQHALLFYYFKNIQNMYYEHHFASFFITKSRYYILTEQLFEVWKQQENLLKYQLNVPLPEVEVALMKLAALYALIGNNIITWPLQWFILCSFLC
jgi:hypothetical protein